MWIDTHCHLDAAEFAEDRVLVHGQAREAGIERMVVPAVAVENFNAVRECCRELAGCVPAYGIHPLCVSTAREDHLAVLRLWLEREKPVAVGEIGLDFFADFPDPDQQAHFFAAQLKLARAFDLPVLLHVRRAVDQVLYHLRRHRVKGGIAHAFNGSAQQAAEFLKLGFALGFGGAMTHPGATRIRRLAAELPPSALVLETDAPDIAPRWLCGGRNSPAELPRIGAELAALRGVSLSVIANQTMDNARRILG